MPYLFILFLNGIIRKLNKSTTKRPEAGENGQAAAEDSTEYEEKGTGPAAV